MSTKPTVTFLAFFLAIAFPGFGQSNYQPDSFRAEVFGGFSTRSMEPGRVDGTGLDKVRLNGWTASFTSYEVFRRWGLIAEFSDTRREKGVVDATSQLILFGGTFRSIERRRFALTGRIMAGTHRWSASSLPSGGFPAGNGFAFQFGQSIDVKLNERMAVRVQPGVALLRRKQVSGDSKLNVVTPLSVGLVFRFGKRP